MTRTLFIFSHTDINVINKVAQYFDPSYVGNLSRVWSRNRFGHGTTNRTEVGEGAGWEAMVVPRKAVLVKEILYFKRESKSVIKSTNIYINMSCYFHRAK